ncbi:helix-turn-helix transcriptional regulator [Arthrobacter sp. UM1]|uniref:helix-turn-helix domain-containing protein n=1 Tax=Arthrobacter sp. UM1 TaxID=2766776 RepID=UPI00299D752F|nr:helix-turn-helix transcriptional regulator [Arthrobacter sp. UM1]MCB4208098.1 helix-turn-helix transcriptional regulator [Arthrobacter sp. UM1]
MAKQPVSVNGVVRWRDVGMSESAPAKPLEPKVIVLRHEIGEVLREARQRQGRTLREVSHDARVSLGYLSEVERGQKEASSELLASIAEALDVPMSSLLHDVADRIALQEGVPFGMTVPDTVPDQMAADYGGRAAATA